MLAIYLIKYINKHFIVKGGGIKLQKVLITYSIWAGGTYQSKFLNSNFIKQLIKNLKPY